MTDETIERVARAMCRAAITKPAAVMYSPEGVEFHVNKRWPEYADQARAAISELSPPDDGNRHHKAKAASMGGHPMTSPEHHSPVSSERVEEMLAGIVKPLKWEARIEGSQIADTPFGHYRVDDALQTPTAAGMQVVLPTWWGPMSNAGTQCVDIAAAKAACEADLVKRVASILSPEILSLRKRNAALAAFVKSFHLTVVDNFYKDVTLHLEQPHALSIRLQNNSDKSWIFADLEARRRLTLEGGDKP